MVGPNTLQKVMAGDQMSATVQYFFESAPGNSTPLTTMLLNTLGQLLSTGSQVGGLVKGNATAVTSQLSGNPGFVNAVNPGQGGTNTPQAYLTMVFFDERFEPIAEADGGVVRQQVAQSVGSGGSTLGLGNIKAPRNGYVLVYVSNSSEQPVYFDNLQVGKVNGNILEENHYYSFGLRISGISSRRFTDQYQGETKNGYLYQGAFAELDDDIGWQDFALRSYDAQIGRFMQMDPFSQFASHYTGMGNDPVNMIDPSGGIGIPCPGTSSMSIFFSTVGEGIMNIASSFSSGSSLIKLGVTATHIGANVYRSATQYSTVNDVLKLNTTNGIGSGVNQKTNDNVVNAELFDSKLESNSIDGPKICHRSLQFVLSPGKTHANAKVWGIPAIYTNKSGMFYLEFGVDIYAPRQISRQPWWTRLAITQWYDYLFLSNDIEKTNKGLEWFKDADEFGDFITNKHKGLTGTLIPWGQLSTVK
jgi:RHS repeat-associated protein